MSILTDFNPPFLPFSLVRDIYIETGVCEGKSLINAANAGFPRLRGVELCARHIEACGSSLSDLGFAMHPVRSPFAAFGQEVFGQRGSYPADQTVLLHCGSSIHGGLQAVLDGVPSSGARAVAWLDAHFSGGEGDVWEPCDGQCPLLEELKIILSYEWAVPPVILVDDINQAASDSWWSTYFVDGTFDRKQWPTFQAIYDLLFPAGFTMLLNAGILYAWKDPYKTS